MNAGNKSISNITNNIGAKSSVEKNVQYMLEVSDDGWVFRKILISGARTLRVCNSRICLSSKLDGAIELESDSGTGFKIWFKDPCQ